MTASPPTFTAAQLARALGKSKRSLWRLLSSAAPSSRALVRGNEAEAWHVAALPAGLQKQLDHEAKRRGFRDVHHLLTTEPTPWRPLDRHGRPLALSDVAAHSVERAQNLKRALEPSLARMNDLSLSNGEFERRGVEDYAKVFGSVITGRHWRDLFKRTVDRDGGAEHWERIEIYLEERPARRVEQPAIFSDADAEDFRELRELVATFKNPVSPSCREESLLWLRAFELFEAMEAAGKVRVKRRLLQFLWTQCPPLSKTANALRANFDRLLKGWRNSERSSAYLLDGRSERAGIPSREPIPQESIDRITWHAARNCGGRISQAVRELTDLDELDPELQAWLSKKFASKSHVPHRLRAAVQDGVRALAPHVQGPRAADKTIPPMELSYEGISSMLAVCPDDFTFPVKLRVPDGKGWWRITRGQVILVIDFRTLCVLSFGLQEEEQPNSLIARTALVRAFREWGLPELIYLERGRVFADAKLISGGPTARRHPNDAGACSDAEIEMGLRQFGIKLIVARRARSKPVERVGGMLQDLMHGEPGYCGREERHDGPEETIHWERELGRGNVKALEHFYTLDQWEARLWELCERYNQTPHDAKAKRNPGLSPLEHFKALWPRENPPSKLSPEIEFLLAHHRIENLEIKDSGIWIRNRGETFRYFDQQTGERRLINRFVTAWFNPEAPERCTFTDSKMRNAFTVERHQAVNALGTDETFERESGRAHAHMSAAARRYRALKAQPWASFRHSVVLTPKTIELGSQIDRAATRAEKQRRDDQSRRRTVRNQAERLGLPPAMVSDADRYEETGTAMMLEAERLQAEIEETNATEQ